MGEGEMNAPCLGLYYQLTDLAGCRGGDECSLSGPLLPAFRPCWMSRGRCMLFSLSGSILPAFRPCWMSRGRCMLFSLSWSGPLLLVFRPSQDVGGDVCCSPCLGLYYQLSDLAGC